MDCGVTVGERRPKSCIVRVDKQEGIVCIGRGQLVMSTWKGREGDMRCSWQQGWLCVFSPGQGCCRMCATHCLGFVAAGQHHPPQAVWPLGAGELLCCVPQLQLSASSQSLVVHPHGSCTGLVWALCSEHRIYSNLECAVKNRQLFVDPVLLFAEF